MSYITVYDTHINTDDVSGSVLDKLEQFYSKNVLSHKIRRHLVPDVSHNLANEACRELAWLLKGQAILYREEKKWVLKLYLSLSFLTLTRIFHRKI